MGSGHKYTVKEGLAGKGIGGARSICYQCTTDCPVESPAPDPAPDPAPAGKWVLAKPDVSCTAGCAAEGLGCSESDFLEHATEVDTGAEMDSVLSPLGKKCSKYKTQYGDNKDTPNIRDDETLLCNVMSSKRSLKTMDCSTEPKPKTGAKRRLCWCSGTAALAPPPKKAPAPDTAPAATTECSGVKLPGAG
jgi:hypothetical protein